MGDTVVSASKSREACKELGMTPHSINSAALLASPKCKNS
jgi:hypothetical protein